MPRLAPPVVPPGRMREGMQPTFDQSSRLRIRPWIGSDGDALIRAFHDPEIRRWHMRELASVDEAAV